MISAYTEPRSLMTLVNALDSDAVDFYIVSVKANGDLRKNA